MVKATAPKKKPSVGSGSGSGSGSSILNFFAKAPATPTTAGRQATPAFVKVEGGGPAKVQGQEQGVMRTSSASKKGKEKEVYGNEADPVVISDDEMTGDASSVVTPAPKAPVVRKESGLKRRKMSPPRPSPPLPSEVIEFDDDGGMFEELESQPQAGPSRPRPRPRSISSPPPPVKPPPFANVPDFQPPPTWPEIINTAPDPAEEEGEDGDEHDRDDDSIAGRDYDHLLDSDDPDEGDEGDGEEDADGNRCETTILDLEEAEAEEIVPLDQPPGPPGRRQPSPTGSIGLNMGGLNLDMEWGEDMEEGMGMEDFGAEEGFDGEVRETEGVIGKRKTKSGAAVPAGKGKGKKAEEKVDKCPMCRMNMKGKTNTVSITLQTLLPVYSELITRWSRNTSIRVSTPPPNPTQSLNPLPAPYHPSTPSPLVPPPPPRPLPTQKPAPVPTPSRSSCRATKSGSNGKTPRLT